MFLLLTLLNEGRYNEFLSLKRFSSLNVFRSTFKYLFDDLNEFRNGLFLQNSCHQAKVSSDFRLFLFFLLFFCQDFNDNNTRYFYYSRTGIVGRICNFSTPLNGSTCRFNLHLIRNVLICGPLLNNVFFFSFTMIGPCLFCFRRTLFKLTNRDRLMGSFNAIW